MIGMIIRRLCQLPLILLVIYTLTFSLAWLIPGNPLEKPEGRRPTRRSDGGHESAVQARLSMGVLLGLS